MLGRQQMNVGECVIMYSRLLLPIRGRAQELDPGEMQGDDAKLAAVVAIKAKLSELQARNLS